MLQAKGRPRRLTQRFSRDFAGRVKYSTLWPSRRDSPSDASRAMPISGDFGGRGNKQREPMRIRLWFAYDSALGGVLSRGRKGGRGRPHDSRRDGGATPMRRYENGGATLALPVIVGAFRRASDRLTDLAPAPCTLPCLNPDRSACCGARGEVSGRRSVASC